MPAMTTSTESKALVKPTVEKLLEVIKTLEGHSTGPDCCRNCLEVNDDVLSCPKCGVNRCGGCKPIHQEIENSLAVYGILELGLSSIILESLLKTYHVEIEICSGCYTSPCSRCTTLVFFPSKDIWGCGDCVCVCTRCSRKFIGFGSKTRREVCGKCWGLVDIDKK